MARFQYRSGEKKKVPAVCAHCSVPFLAYEQEVKRGRGRFCSRACWAANTRATGRLAGAANPRWRGGVATDRMAYKRRTEARHPERAAARVAVFRALRSGRLVRQPCEACGATPAEGHHDDYSRPLDVRWLCRLHHDQHHQSAGNSISNKVTNRV